MVRESDVLVRDEEFAWRVDLDLTTSAKVHPQLVEDGRVRVPSVGEEILERNWAIFDILAPFMMVFNDIYAERREIVRKAVFALFPEVETYREVLADEEMSLSLQQEFEREREYGWLDREGSSVIIML